jgi:hypothetical protein
MDLYVRECTGEAVPRCWDYVAGHSTRTGGTWSGGVCQVWTSLWYTPRLGVAARHFKVVVSAGVGHVPSAAKIYAIRLTD